MKFATPSFLVIAISLIASTAMAQPGTLDPSFNGTGIQILQPGPVHDVGNDVIALDDTTTLVCGVTQQAGVWTVFVVRLLQDGSVDPAWGTSAGYTFVPVGLEAYAYDMVQATDGSIYLCGTTYI